MSCSDLCLCGVCTAGLLSRMENSHLFISRKDGAEKEVTSPRFWLISLMWVTRRRGGDGMDRWMPSRVTVWKSHPHHHSETQRVVCVCVCVSQWLFKHIPYVLCYFCRILHLKNAVSHNAICMVIHFDGQMKQYQM